MTRLRQSQRVMMMTDILAHADHQETLIRARRQWGHWRFLTKTWELAFEERPGKNSYLVDLERCGTSAAMLDWIFQVNQKTWATPEVVGDLVRALRDIFDPQARLCTWGASRGIEGTVLDTQAFLSARYGSEGDGQ